METSVTAHDDQQQPVLPSLLERRSVLAGGLMAGVALLLGGCKSSGSSTASADLPDAVWPDEMPPSPRMTPPAGPTGPVVTTGPAVVPGVMPRAAWTNVGPALSRANPMSGGIRRITVHHAAMNSSSIRSQADAARMLNSIRADHVRRRDPRTGSTWADIGYHYMVDPQGRVWEGRPTNLQGAHVQDNNENNLGILMLGDFETQQPTQAALASLDGFVSSQMKRYGVPVSRVYTHRELKPTMCPGRNLQRYMLATRARSGRMANA